MLVRLVGWLVALLACCWAVPSWAGPQEPDIVVGRADADASGGWPVALWPGLAATEPQWLVVYVVGPEKGSLVLKDIPQLRVPDELRMQDSFGQRLEFRMPAAAAASFPAIHAALLEHATTELRS